MIPFSPKAGSGADHSNAMPFFNPPALPKNDPAKGTLFRDIPTRLRHSSDVLSERNRRDAQR
jgi:hypothetical protein